MKKFAPSMLLAIFAMVIFTINVNAKCQYGSDWSKNGKKIIVCTKGDSFSDRKNAQEICSKVKGSSCSSPTTFSSSCGNGECYDESGKNSYSLSGY